MSLHPAVAVVRRSVRRALAEVEPGQTVVVACSGGADSLALLAASASPLSASSQLSFVQVSPSSQTRAVAPPHVPQKRWVRFQ